MSFVMQKNKNYENIRARNTGYIRRKKSGVTRPFLCNFIEKDGSPLLASPASLKLSGRSKATELGREPLSPSTIDNQTRGVELLIDSIAHS